MILLTARESRELDRISQEKYGVPSYDLMTRAGHAVATALLRRWPDVIARGVLVIAGKGNNGGDGFVAARRLRETGESVRVVLLVPASELKGDALRAHAEYVRSGGHLLEAPDDAAVENAIRGEHGVVIDAVLGTGLVSEVRGVARTAIEAMNRLAAPIVAVDIASGINSDTGAAMGAAVQASLTVTFGYAKYGHVSYPGADLTGELDIFDIGFPPAALADISPRGRFVERADAARLIRPRRANTHKGTYGHPLIIAGSRGKSGAAILVSSGALRTGAGLVTAAIPDCVYPIVAAGIAELMTEPMPDCDGHFAAKNSIERLKELSEGKTSIIAGPGIGVSNDTRELIEWIIQEGVLPERPAVLDADALNVIAADGPTILKKARGQIVLTPHPGEMSRLLRLPTTAVNADRISAARRLADTTGASVLLKGARSVIATADGGVFINSSGNAGMGTPGMGDVLSGIVGALLGQEMTAEDALKLGVFIHGHAADRLAERIGPVGYLAGDLAAELPFAFVS